MMVGLEPPISRLITRKRCDWAGKVNLWVTSAQDLRSVAESWRKSMMVVQSSDVLRTEAHGSDVFIADLPRENLEGVQGTGSRLWTVCMDANGAETSAKKMNEKNRNTYWCSAEGRRIEETPHAGTMVVTVKRRSAEDES
jgi:hypothetical protein